MKRMMNVMLMLCFGLQPGIFGGAMADWQGLLKEQLETLREEKGDESSSSDSVVSAPGYQNIVAGLKQALDRGAEYAVEHLGKKDGFWKNAEVKIPMPENLSAVEKILRKLDQDKYVDEFVLTINRAAESAVPLTYDIIKKAVQDMNVAEAKKILEGPDDAATRYLRKAGGDDMTRKISPIVAEATARAGVTSHYKKLFTGLGAMGKYINPDDYDVDRYVTEKTVDGIFHMIAVEEQKIRKDPAARATDLLKQVFGDQ